MSVIVRAVLIGMLIAFAGTVPRNLFFLANQQVFPQLPWEAPGDREAGSG